MTDLGLLTKTYNVNQLKQIDNLLKAQFEGLNIEAEVKAVATGRWVQVSLSGEDEAGNDRLVADGYRAHRRTTDLIDGHRCLLDRDRSRECGLARRVLSLGGGQNLTHDDFGHIRSLDAAPLQDLANDDRAEIGGGERAQRTVE